MAPLLTDTSFQTFSFQQFGAHVMRCCGLRRAHWHCLMNNETHQWAKFVANSSFDCNYHSSLRFHRVLILPGELGLKHTARRDTHSGALSRHAYCTNLLAGCELSTGYVQRCPFSKNLVHCPYVPLSGPRSPGEFSVPLCSALHKSNMCGDVGLGRNRWTVGNRNACFPKIRTSPLASISQQFPSPHSSRWSWNKRNVFSDGQHLDP